jgi:diguanylate cyclase (GGDEF)-like protein
MPAFDLRTIIMMSSIMLSLMALVMFSLRHSFPTNIRGVGNWTIGALVLSTSAILLALRGSVPDWLSIVAANSGILAGTGLWLAGSQRFFGRPASWRFLVLILVVGAIALSWMTWVHESINGRTLCMTAILALIYSGQSAVMLRYGRRENGAKFLAALFLIMTVVAVTRFVATFSSRFAVAGLFASNIVQMAYITTNTLMSLTVPVGFLLLAMERLRNQLELQSRIDPLTGLLNRRAFLSAHQEAREMMRTGGGLLSLLLIDLDHFKAINDTYGHAKGDEILVDFSTRVAAMLPRQHHFARWGGEEFVVLLPGSSPENTIELAETIRSRIALNAASSLPAYTCCIGIACVGSGDATIERLVKDADEALYRAKHNGRNYVEVSDRVILS